MTKFGMVTPEAEKHVSHALHGGGGRDSSVPKIFVTSLHAHAWYKKQQPLRGDQIKCEKNFYTRFHPFPSVFETVKVAV